MPNGGLYGDDSYGRSREELTYATDIVIVAKKALSKIEKLEAENAGLKKILAEREEQLETLRKAMRVLKDT